MSEIKNIGDNEQRILIDDFKGMDSSTHPTKLPLDVFRSALNWVRLRQADGGSMRKRYGIQLYNTNQLTASKPVRNLSEVRFNEQYYLLGKDVDGAGTSDLSYNAISSGQYKTSWDGDASTAEHEGYYRFLTFRNRHYICNRVTSGNVLDYNKVWTPDTLTTLYEHGCLPYQRDALSWVTFTSTVDTNAGMTASGFYAYIIVYLYDGYQQSSAFDIFWATSTQKSMLIDGLVANYNRVTHFKIYRSKNQTDTTSVPEFFYYVATLKTTATSYRDTMADSLLGEAIPSEQLFDQKRPYRCKHLTIARERLIQGNLDSAPGKYTALGSSDVTLTEGGASVFSGLDAGTYKYRIYKAYAVHSGGRYVYVLGNYLEKSITVTGAGNSVTLSLVTPPDDAWLDSYVIQRTLAGGNQFFTLGELFQASGTNYDVIGFNQSAFELGLVDEAPDANIIAWGATYYKHDLILAEDIQSTTLKNAVAISEIGEADRVSATSIKLLDIPDNVGITGLYSEDSRIIAFSSTAIHMIDTSAQSPEYWLIDKVVDGIGALGQPTAPSTEGTGHNAIQQLPDQRGYLFFNRAYATTGQRIIAYLWTGAGQPEKISDQIDSILNDSFSTFNVTGMAYDRVNDWVWIIYSTNSAQKILVYDLFFKTWYVFTTNASNTLHDIVVTQNGEVIIGCGDGRLVAYTVNTYKDTYSTGTEHAYSAYLQSREFNSFDSNFIVKQIVVNCETTTNQVSISAVIVYDGTSTPLTLANTASETTHRVKGRSNIKTKSWHFTLDHSENKGLVINSIAIDTKLKHQKDG